MQPATLHKHRFPTECNHPTLKTCLLIPWMERCLTVVHRFHRKLPNTYLISRRKEKKDRNSTNTSALSYKW